MLRYTLGAVILSCFACKSPTSPPRAWAGTWVAVRANAQPLPWRTSSSASYTRLDSVRLSLPEEGQGAYAERATQVDVDGSVRALNCDVPMSVATTPRTTDGPGSLSLRIGEIPTSPCKFSITELVLPFSVSHDTLQLDFRGYRLQFVRR